MANPQLRLVQEALQPMAEHGTDPTRRVFEHWVSMLGRSIRRCKLGPTRRAAINAALLLYSVDELMLAVEGMASDPMEGVADEAAESMRELEWFLAREARVERWMARGEKLRASAERQAERERQPAAAQPQAPVDPQALQQQHDRLRTLAAQLRERGRAHG